MLTICQKLAVVVKSLRVDYANRVLLPPSITGSLSDISLKFASAGRNIYAPKDAATLSRGPLLLRWLGNQLIEAILPVNGESIYEPYLYLLSHPDDKLSLLRKRWAEVNCCQLRVFNGVRVLWATIDYLGEQPCLILRFVESKESLNTRTVKVPIPHTSEKSFVPLLQKLRQALGREYRAYKAKDLEGPEPTHALEILNLLLLDSSEDMQHFLQDCMPVKNSLLTKGAEIIIHIKLGMRHVFWKFLDEPLISIALEPQKMAAQGNIYRCLGGFSLINNYPYNRQVEPHFGISFAEYRERARDLYRYTQNNIQFKGKNRFILKLQPKPSANEEEEDNAEISNSVDVQIFLYNGHCWEEYRDSDEQTSEKTVLYHEVSLCFSETPAIKVSLKLFHIQNEEGQWVNPISEEEWCDQVCWLLAVLKSKWYEANG
jgi:hypothetical protein